jgi:methyl-accepting chemotaxis protein
MKWSVGTKIGAGFGLALFILAAIGVLAYTNTSNLVQAAQWRTHTYIVIGALDRLLSEAKDAETGQRGFVLTGDEAYLEPYNTATRTLDNTLGELRTLTVDNPAQQRRLDALAPVLKAKLDGMQRAIDQRRSAGLEAARAVVMTGTGKEAMDNIRGLLKEMAATEQDLLQQREDRLQRDSARTLAVILYGIPLAFVVLAIVAWAITRNIADPLREIVRGATQIAEGDLSVRLTVSDRADEVGVLQRAFALMTRGLQDMAAVATRIADGDISGKVIPHSERDVLGNAFALMIDRLRGITQDLNGGINVLVSAAAEILAATEQMASGSAETVTAVSQTSSTVEEVKQTTQMASQKARVVADTAQRTAQISQAGTQTTQESIDAMQRIQEQMNSIAGSIVQLSEQGQAIGEIIATVNSLAEQSNLLAVNASIEAAKAGEQGKGFVVVAQEVKSLAVQSKQATAQVRTILGDIQRATSAAVRNTEQGSREVEVGGKLSESLGDAVRSLADNIETAAQAATQIAASAQQQMVGMDQVALAMQNIQEATSQSLASTRQTESAAQNLHQLGLKLQKIVEQYRT